MGLLRLFLSIGVVYRHTLVFFHDDLILAGNLPGIRQAYGFLGSIGYIDLIFALNYYRVQIFFVLSGFLMALILNGKYSKLPVFSFYTRRILSIYPAFLISAILGVVLVFPFIVQVWSNQSIFGHIIYVIRNFFMLGADHGFLVAPCSSLYPSDVYHNLRALGTSCSIINLPSWSLGVEVAFYFIAPFVVKNLKSTILFFMYGLVFHLSISFLKNPPTDILPTVIFIKNQWVSIGYLFYGSSFIYFGGGALAYHISKYIKKHGILQSGFSKAFQHKYAISFIVFIILVSLVGILLPSKVGLSTWGLVLFCLVLPFLASRSAKSKLDKILSPASYHVFIFHWPILGLLSVYMYNKENPYFMGLHFGNFAVGVVILFSFCFYFFLDKRINKHYDSKVVALAEKIEKGNYTPNFLERHRIYGIIGKSIVSIYLVVPIFVMSYIFYKQYFGS